MTITEKRAKSIDFTDRIYRIPAVIIGPKSEPVAIDFSNPGSVKGKILGVQESTIHFNFAEKFFASTATIKAYKSPSDLDMALSDGWVDLAMEDAVWAYQLLNSDAGKELEVKATAPWDPTLGAGVGAGLRKGDTDLRDKLNVALKAVRTNGTYERIAERYFTFDPYGE